MTANNTVLISCKNGIRILTFFLCLVILETVMSRLFNLKHHLGISSQMTCCVCSFPFDREVRWPITGRCGHTICAGCHQEHVVSKTPNDGQWQPCPTGGCRYNQSFEIEPSPTVMVLEVGQRLAEIESGVGDFVLQSSTDARHRKEMVELKNVYAEALSSKRKEIGEKDAEIERLNNTIAGMREYKEAVKQHGVMHYSASDNSCGAEKGEEKECAQQTKRSVLQAGEGSEDSLDLSDPSEPRQPRGDWKKRRFRLRKVSIERPGNRNEALLSVATKSSSEEEFV